MKVDSFIFYEAFYEAIMLLDPTERFEAFEAICRYALYGEESDELSTGAEIVFILSKNFYPYTKPN